MPEHTRFAPSPTGWLHLGHVHAALFAAGHARRSGGRFLLRIEDLDAGRCRPEFAHAIDADLAWLGLVPDGEVRVQSRHLAEYAACLARLRDERLAYPCFCTRSEIRREVAAIVGAPHAPDGAPLYPGTCRVLSDAERRDRIGSGAPFAIRLDVAAACRRVGAPLAYADLAGDPVPVDPARFGDVVLGRKDCLASYHLAVTHDDALAGVTLVTRAEDLAAVTGIHRLLQSLFGWPAPRYAFHPLLRDAKGRRLSKRDGARPLRDLRDNGLSPETVRMLAGFAPEAI